MAKFLGINVDKLGTKSLKVGKGLGAAIVGDVPKGGKWTDTATGIASNLLLGRKDPLKTSGLTDPRDLARQTSRISARRPVRGIQIKRDTYASLRIVDNGGNIIEQIDAAGKEGAEGKGISVANTNFLAQTISEDRVEKSQVVETFGEEFVFFFGQRPRFINVSGFLLNTADFNWRAEWWHNYDTRLRGTKLVERNARAYLAFDDILIEGYLMQTSAQDLATEPYRIPFSFTMYLTRRFNIGIRGISQTGDTQPLARLAGIIPPKSKSGGNLGSGFLDTLVDLAVVVKDADLTTTSGAGRTKFILDTLKTGGARFISSQQKGILSGLVDPGQVGLSEQQAQRRLRLAFTNRGFGPLRNNWDEFLNSEFDRFDYPRPGPFGQLRRNLMRKLVGVIPGLNNPQTLNKLLGQIGPDGRTPVGLSIPSGKVQLGGTLGKLAAKGNVDTLQKIVAP